MEREETNLVQKTPSRQTEADSNRCEKHKVESYPNKQVLPFYFVKIWPKDTDEECIIQDAVKLFEEKGQQELQISEKIREKVFDRERVLQRLKDLKSCYLYRLIDQRKDSLTHLYLALDNSSFIKSSSAEEKLEKLKLNFRMLHKSKSLTQEKHLLREINMSQQRDGASTSPLADHSKIVSLRQWNHNNVFNLNCDRPLEEIKQFGVTKKVSARLRESMRNQVKIICDELMEMRKKTRRLETEVNDAEKELEAINAEIWSFQEHLNVKHHRKEASLFVLGESNCDGLWRRWRWTLKRCNLEYESMHSHTTTYLKKLS